VNGGPIEGVEYSVVLRISFHEIFLHAWISGSVKESFTYLASDALALNINVGVAVRIGQNFGLQRADFQLPAYKAVAYYIELCFPTKLNNVGLLVILVCGDMVMDDFERNFVDGCSDGDLEDKFGLQRFLLSVYWRGLVAGEIIVTAGSGRQSGVQPAFHRSWRRMILGYVRRYVRCLPRRY
jgi:hypothetical protein